MIKHNLKNKIAAVRKLQQQLPTQLGLKAVVFFKDNFRAGGFVNNGVDKWKPRKAKNKRAVLVKSGALKKSIRVLSTGTNSVIVGSTLPYAAIHNDGGKIQQKVTQKQRGYFLAQYEKTKNAMWLRMAQSAELNIELPKRKFIGESRELTKQMKKFIIDKLKKI